MSKQMFSFALQQAFIREIKTILLAWKKNEISATEAVMQIADEFEDKVDDLTGE